MTSAKVQLRLKTSMYFTKGDRELNEPKKKVQAIFRLTKTFPALPGF
jgi:hypothetical protein